MTETDAAAPERWPLALSYQAWRPLSLKQRYDLLKLRLEFGSLKRVVVDLAEDDFQLGAWIIVIARGGCRSRREEGVGEVAGECPNECNADKHRDRRDHLAGIGHWI